MMAVVISTIPLQQFLCLLLLSAAVRCEEKYYKIYQISTTNLNILSNTRQVRSKIDCARECTNLPECVGFLYNKRTSTSTCTLGCFNIEQLNCTEGEDDVYVTSFSYLLARDKPVTMSSVYQDRFQGSYSVDGVYEPPSNDEHLSLTITNADNKPWVRVDLLNMHCIWAVRILNRGADVINAQRARKVILTASQLEENINYDANPASLCAYHDGVINQYYTAMTCNQPMRAQFIQMQLNVTDHLNIYEFEVHGV